MRRLPTLHVKGESAVLPDRAIRRQSHYFIYRSRITSHYNFIKYYTTLCYTLLSYINYVKRYYIISYRIKLHHIICHFISFHFITLLLHGEKGLESITLLNANTKKEQK